VARRLRHRGQPRMRRGYRLAADRQSIRFMLEKFDGHDVEAWMIPWYFLIMVRHTALRLAYPAAVPDNFMTIP